MDVVEELLEGIQLMPESHRMISKRVRRALTRRFPFSVYYLIEADEVVVIGVLHSQRDPSRWKARS
ncbi:MAG: hypothetical protein AB7I30_05950 [Isosphaeraceae bacterium]